MRRAIFSVNALYKMDGKTPTRAVWMDMAAGRNHGDAYIPMRLRSDEARAIAAEILAAAIRADKGVESRAYARARRRHARAMKVVERAEGRMQGSGR